MSQSFWMRRRLFCPPNNGELTCDNLLGVETSFVMGVSACDFIDWRDESGRVCACPSFDQPGKVVSPIRGLFPTTNILVYQHLLVPSSLRAYLIVHLEFSKEQGAVVNSPPAVHSACVISITISSLLFFPPTLPILFLLP